MFEIGNKVVLEYYDPVYTGPGRLTTTVTLSVRALAPTYSVIDAFSLGHDSQCAVASLVRAVGLPVKRGVHEVRQKGAAGSS